MDYLTVEGGFIVKKSKFVVNFENGDTNTKTTIQAISSGDAALKFIDHWIKVDTMIEDDIDEFLKQYGDIIVREPDGHYIGFYVKQFSIQRKLNIHLEPLKQIEL